MCDLRMPRIVKPQHVVRRLQAWEVVSVTHAKISQASTRDLQRLQVWEAVEDLRASGNWQLPAVPDFSRDFEAVLAVGTPHELDALAVPEGPPCIRGTQSPSEVRSDSCLRHYLWISPSQPPPGKEWKRMEEIEERIERGVCSHTAQGR